MSEYREDSSHRSSYYDTDSSDIYNSNEDPNVSTLFINLSLLSFKPATICLHFSLFPYLIIPLDGVATKF
jgi:hypothetical protein